MTYGNYPDLHEIKKILVIKLRHLGDVLLTTPVFAVLKRHLPDAEIDAYIYEEARPMLEGHPAIAEIFGHERKKGWGRWLAEGQLLWKIWRKGYDCVINLTEGDRGAIATWVSRAKVRVGWQRKLYTHLVKQAPGLRHMVERNLDAVRRMGLFPAPNERELLFQVSAPLISGPFVLVHPTSRWKFKCWPKKKMRALVEWLLERGEKVVLTSGPDREEEQMVAAIADGLDVVNLAGQVTLKELGGLIREAKLLICVDSMPLHMASALKRPVVALFGPTSDVTWGPWRNPQAKVVAQPFSCRPCYQDGCGGSKHSDCLATLPVALVQKAILELEVLAKVGAAGCWVGDELIDCARK